MPRVPAVFEKKTSWRPYEEQASDPVDKANYSSAVEKVDAIEAMFVEEEALGVMQRWDEQRARDEFPGKVRVAAIGALEKAGGSFRIIHDATHEVKLNPEIVVRDQTRGPGIPEVRVIMADLGPEPRYFALAGDVKRARRLVKVRRQDWGLLACRLRDGELWLNTVGTFGVASASYHWSRLASGLSRAVLYCLGRRALYQLLYADDYLWAASGEYLHENLVFTVFFLTVLGVPWSWGKFRGGFALDWIGFHMDWTARMLGLSQARASWLARWMKTCLSAEFTSVLGRLAFAAQALELLRPFLGPLYAWVSVLPPGAVLPVPAMVQLCLRYLATELESGARLLPCRVVASEPVELFRTDARADGEEVWIGGWEITRGGRREGARWFMEKLSREDCGWAWEAGEPFRSIASLELLATLAAVVCFGLEDRRATSGVVAFTGSTDNLGNKHVLSKLQTTKYPLCCVLMEIASRMQRANLSLSLQWLPRLQNAEADQLTNGDCRGFTPELRQRFRPGGFRGLVLHDMLEAGRALYKEVRDQRVGRGVRRLAAAASRKRKSAVLGGIGPWE